MCAGPIKGKAVPQVGKLIVANRLIDTHCIWHTRAATVTGLSAHCVVCAAIPARILYIQAPKHAAKLVLKIGQHLVYRIAATLVGVYVATVQTNNSVIPAIRNIEIIWVWRANNSDGRRYIHRKYGWVDSRKTRGSDWKTTIVIVLCGVESGVQNFCYRIHKWATKGHIHWLIGTNADFKIRDVLIDIIHKRPNRQVVNMS